MESKRVRFNARHMPRLPKCATIEDLIHAYILLFIFLIYRQNLNFRVIKGELPGIGREKFIGRTRLTKLGSMITETIGKFSGGGMGYDLIAVCYTIG